MKVYYFGCLGEVGHFMYEPPGRVTTESNQFTLTNPWRLEVDGKLCPDDATQPEGIARLHVRDGWTAVAFWDRSLDARPGSCSVFLVEGELEFDAAVKAARSSFPAVLERFKFPVQLAVE